MKLKYRETRARSVIFYLREVEKEGLTLLGPTGGQIVAEILKDGQSPWVRQLSLYPRGLEITADVEWSTKMASAVIDAFTQALKSE